MSHVRAYDRALIAAHTWNTLYPVGTRVLYWKLTLSDKGRRSATRSQAWVMPSGSAVVQVEGEAGAIALSHVEAIA